MFTGIIQHRGVVAALKLGDGRAALLVQASGWAHVPEHGQSIAVNGCCLTMANQSGENAPDLLRFDVITQTLQSTALGDLAVGDAVNLEHAVTPATLLGGHIVQGHVDGVAVVAAVEDRPGERRVRIVPPPPLLDSIVEKGSIAIDGVSLTVAGLGESDGNGWFEVALIPTTLQHTTLGNIRQSQRVNLETDYIAKTVIHWLRRSAGNITRP